MYQKPFVLHEVPTGFTRFYVVHKDCGSACLNKIQDLTPYLHSEQPSTLTLVNLRLVDPAPKRLSSIADLTGDQLGRCPARGMFRNGLLTAGLPIPGLPADNVFVYS